MKELIEQIDLDQRAYDIINFGVFDAQTEAELNRKATLNLIMQRIRKNRKDLLTLLSNELHGSV